ncbi:unnamed protein product [Prorocentrum cordatum]|uniref:Uncharacterized protein n=1 Tax=Prorocentrum cordatum TaxID=2364126 RepID=A0ABN9V222_9DINO|nr:unnamed protein product [Polarella glacialis]
MVGYLLTDSLTSNAEDRIYQHVHLDPGHMLLGMQAASGIVAWCTLLVSGQLGPAVLFLAGHSKALVHVFVLVLAEACGAYACTVTVRLFGPAVFTLLLMSHQILSLLISVALFNHRVSPWSCFCLVVVALVVLTSSIRRVTTTRQGVSKERCRRSNPTLGRIRHGAVRRPAPCTAS